MRQSGPTPPAWQLSLLVAGAVMVASIFIHAGRLGPSDFSLIWAAARSSRPYEVGILPGWPLPLLYPWTAVMVVSPLALLPLMAATSVFASIGAGLLAYAVIRREPNPSPSWLVFLSAPFMYAVMVAQWSPILTAAALLPWGGFLFACKPTVAAWLWAWRPSWRAVWLAAGCTVASVLLRPIWPLEWQKALDAADFVIAPVSLPWGWLLLGAAVAWRRPDARLLLVMCCVPHTAMIYEALPLMLTVRTWRESCLLCGLSWVALVGHWWMGPYSSQEAYVRVAAGWTAVCVYAPAAIFLVVNHLQDRAHRCPSQEWAG